MNVDKESGISHCSEKGLYLSTYSTFALFLSNLQFFEALHSLKLIPLPPKERRSESWNMENNPLANIVSIKNHKLHMNINQRNQRDWNPLMIVNQSRCNVKQLCQSSFTVHPNVATYLFCAKKILFLIKKIDHIAVYHSKL